MKYIDPTGEFNRVQFCIGVGYITTGVSAILAGQALAPVTAGYSVYAGYAIGVPLIASGVVAGYESVFDEEIIPKADASEAVFYNDYGSEYLDFDYYSDYGEYV